MNIEIRVAAGEVAGVHGAADFPLQIGGADAVVPVPDAPDGPPLAWLGIADQHVFVQPAEGGPGITHNGVRVGSSVWLRDGDVMVVAGARLSCQSTSTGLSLTVAAVAADAGPVAMRPPSTPPPTALTASPSRATRTGGRPPRPAPAPRERARPGRVSRLALWCAFATLVAAGAFVFTATPVAITITPVPATLVVDGAIPALALAGRRLMVPGVYEITATREGYHPLHETLEVPRGPRLDLAYSLQRLPGLLRFELDPPGEVRVEVDGELAGTTPLAPLELEAGEHSLRLERPRYRVLEQLVEIEGLGREQVLSTALEPLWASVHLESVPAGASVSLAGEVLGTTPLDLDLLEGRQVLQLQLDRHDPVTLALEVVAQVPMSPAPLVLRESDGVLTLTTSPAGATITVDGEFAGRSPVELALRPGSEHRVAATLAGFGSVARAVRVEPAETRALALDLPRLYGTVFVAAIPADAELLVDGKPRGAANQRLRLSAVPHDIEFRREGFEPYRTRVTPRPGVSLEVKARLKSLAEGRAERTPAVLRTGAGQELRLIRPEGTFTMGASRREQGARANEYRRLVELTRPYYMGVKEVTSAEFRAFRQAHRAGLAGSHSLDGDPQAVVNVTWNDAVEYLNWLSVNDGLEPAYVRRGESYALVEPPTIGYRLPTEAEWAYVARFSAGREDRFPWPGGFPPAAVSGNYADESAAGLLPNTIDGYDDGQAVSAPVGSYAPGPAGLFDLGGNVAEWCHDYYAVYPDAARRLARDPIGPPSGKHRVVRGSSWRHWSISELRMSYRDYALEARHDLGFRIARSVE